MLKDKDASRMTNEGVCVLTYPCWTKNHNKDSSTDMICLDQQASVTSSCVEFDFVWKSLQVFRFFLWSFQFRSNTKYPFHSIPSKQPFKENWTSLLSCQRYYTLYRMYTHHSPWPHFGGIMGKHVNSQCNPWWVEGEEQREEDQSEIE